MDERFTSPFKLVAENATFCSEIPDAIQNYQGDTLIVSVLGAQNTGKSTFLNSTLGSTFQVREEDSESYYDRITCGIDAALVNGYLAIDIEGIDNVQNGELRSFTTYGTFALCVSDLVIYCIESSNIHQSTFWDQIKLMVGCYLKFKDQNIKKRDLIFLIKQQPGLVRIETSENNIRNAMERIAITFGAALSDILNIQCYYAIYDPVNRRTNNQEIANYIHSRNKNNIDIIDKINMWKELFQHISDNNSDLQGLYDSDWTKRFNRLKEKLKQEISQKFAGIFSYTIECWTKYGEITEELKAYIREQLRHIERRDKDELIDSCFDEMVKYAESKLKTKRIYSIPSGMVVLATLCGSSYHLLPRTISVFNKSWLRFSYFTYNAYQRHQQKINLATGAVVGGGAVLAAVAGNFYVATVFIDGGYMINQHIFKGIFTKLFQKYIPIA